MTQLMIRDNIENMIYEVRGKQVMLDKDIAFLYNTETRRINEVVKRNINRFPIDFCFQLTLDEWKNLKSQNATSSSSNYGGVRKLPYVFTEYGVIMLSGLLKSEIAVEVNKKVIKAFVKLKKYISINNYDKRISNLETKYINHDNQLLDQNERIDILFDKLDSKEKINHIFFEGQIYDAYSLLIDILSKAKKEIIIIDNYAGKEIFDILKNIKVSIKIVTKNIDDILIKKYQKQYNNIEIINKDNFHDRFIIIDKETLYHSGASLKDLGKKCFGINKIEDKNYLKQLLESVN